MEHGMMDGMMGCPLLGGYGMWTFNSILLTLALVGIVAIIWLWVVKMYKDVRKKKK